MGNPLAAALAGDADTVTAIGFVGLSVSGIQWPQGGDLIGWALTEATGLAPVTLDILDGTTAQGSIIARLVLAANQTSIVRPSSIGWPLTVGCYVVIESGSVTGSLVIGRDQ